MCVVVPCYPVFQDLFPFRFVEVAGSGGRTGSVKSYNSFCRYLLAKRASFGAPTSAVLPFVGKNKVIYSLPDPSATEMTVKEGRVSG